MVNWRIFDASSFWNSTTFRFLKIKNLTLLRKFAVIKLTFDDFKTSLRIDYKIVYSINARMGIRQTSIHSYSQLVKSGSTWYEFNLSAPQTQSASCFYKSLIEDKHRNKFESVVLQLEMRSFRASLSNFYKTNLYKVDFVWKIKSTPLYSLLYYFALFCV